ncbi:hypothetical protein [Deinococcus multiflagellatus]|uniref:Uncharacterized protein n=1 Tax=Deinococcus multiflagellatus TaxID=1656887 RepID=A0ABW1ZPM9_9DEIO|nr:hypothetical protein [Deinococcus multiflagellatus]MBZ9715340.1 hypothetical protein [Deinococcus multiflagellatus]
MSQIEALTAGVARDAAQRLGERHGLPWPAEYVTVPSGTVHLREAGAARTICGTRLPLPPRTSTVTTGEQALSCTRCQAKVRKARAAKSPPWLAHNERPNKKIKDLERRGYTLRWLGAEPHLALRLLHPGGHDGTHAEGTETACVMAAYESARDHAHDAHLNELL